MKDIFIDNNIAKNFSNPVDNEYKKLITWLMNYTPIPTGGEDNTNAYLVVSQKLLNEYYRSALYANANTSIPAIIDKLTREGRRLFITKQAIEDFKREYFSKKVTKNLRSNAEDRELIPVVFLSNRKYVLSLDENFTFDLLNFPHFGQLTKVESRPENLPYDE